MKHVLSNGDIFPLKKPKRQTGWRVLSGKRLLDYKPCHSHIYEYTHLGIASKTSILLCCESPATRGEFVVGF